jgi:beta-galactosidase GanA
VRLSNSFRFLLPLVTVFCALPITFAIEAPKLVEKDGRWALFVEGRPYLILGGQIHNSSAWPSELPEVWTSLAALHANTVEAPVYWEQIEPQLGQFDFANVDLLVKGARAHNLHVVLLWFGTWKNGNMHYVPKWVKTDPKRFPRMINASGEPIDVLSANSRANLEADKTAFAALLRHLKGWMVTSTPC